MKLFFSIILGLFFVFSSGAQSQLPKEMPAKITIDLYNGGGMTRSYKKIKIENGLLEFAELSGKQAQPETWWATISPEDMAKLYKIFFENKFDTIKNDKRTEIVYDAGSENISLSADGKYYRATSGKNSPLSGKNLKRYMAISKAIHDLAAAYESKRNDSQADKIAMGEIEEYIQGRWRAGGGHGIRAWFLEWSFDKGSFKTLGYPMVTQQGKYRPISLAGNKLTLELFDQKGTFGEKNRMIEILINKETKQLTISNMQGFSRMNK